MKKIVTVIALLALIGCASDTKKTAAGQKRDIEVVAMFPKNNTTNVNPDTHLVLTFPSPPTIGSSGLIRIYDAADNSLVDTLDMSIPPSPRPTGRAPPRIATDPNSGPGPADPNDKMTYQVNIIGGLDFHFFPIIVRGNVATIYPHNNALKYGHKYFVKIDPAVLTTKENNFAGFTTDTAWTFATKATAPSSTATRITVAADGRGDFNTVQGAF